MLKKIMIAVGIVLFVGGMVAHAAVPHKINFQGRITTGPLEEGTPIVFAIPNPAAPGEPLWSENWTVTHTSPPAAPTEIYVDENGMFSVDLGSQIPITPAIIESATDLSISVGGADPVSQPLASVPFALMAEALPGVVVKNGRMCIGTTEAMASMLRVVGSEDLYGTMAFSLPFPSVNVGVSGYSKGGGAYDYGVYGKTEKGVGVCGESSSVEGKAGLFKGEVEIDGNVSIKYPRSLSVGGSLSIGSDLSIGGDVVGNTSFKNHIITYGNIGIETANPAVELHIKVANAEIRVEDDNYYTQLQPNDLRFNRSNGSSYITQAGDGNLVFETSNTEAMRINKDGDVGIGTDTPNYTLDVNGQIRSSRGVCDGSDLRWKKNIVSLKGALQKVLQLRGVFFEWRTSEHADAESSAGTNIGLIAQEVEPVIPEVVTTDKEGYKSIYYQKLVPVLVEAIKELKAENAAAIEELKAENEALRADIEALKAK